MLGPKRILFLPKDFSDQEITAAFVENLGWIRFGRQVRTMRELLKLYNITFDRELASAVDFCMVPAGWVEHHGVYLPDVIEITTETQIKARLERMLHAPQAQDAIAFLLEAASHVTRETTDRKLKRRSLIDMPATLARRLAHVRTKDPAFVDALMRGRLYLCLSMIKEGQLKDLQREAATRLLIMMARLWGLHDLQIIAARLHQSIYHPTNFFVEGENAGPQSSQALAKDLFKLAEMAAIASRLQLRKPGDIDPTDGKEEQRFWGFVTATPFKAVAREWGLACGLSADDLDKIQTGTCTDLCALEKLLRPFALAAELFGPAIAQDLSETWDDGAPSGKKAGPKAVSHASVAASRYGMDAHVALAHAIIAFITFSDRLPARVEQLLGSEARLPDPVNVMKDHHRVTFELMFAAYRAIFLRDPNHLRTEISDLLPTGLGARRLRQDFILGRTSTLEERLGRDSPLLGTDGFKPPLKTTYGEQALRKALAIILRDRKSHGAEFDARFAPAIFERMYPLPPLTSSDAIPEVGQINRRPASWPLHRGPSWHRLVELSAFPKFSL